MAKSGGSQRAELICSAWLQRRRLRPEIEELEAEFTFESERADVAKAKAEWPIKISSVGERLGSIRHATARADRKIESHRLRAK